MSAALAAAQARVERFPQDAEAHNDLGMLLGDEGRFLEAVACFRRALAITRHYPQALHNLGMALMELGETEEAARTYRELLLLAPRVAQVHADLGIALLRLGKATEAEASYRTAATLDPGSVDTRLGIGKALRRQGRLAEAEPEYRRALELDPKHVEAHCTLAVTLADLGRISEAEQCFQAALRLDPASYVANADYAYVLMTAGRLEEAEPLYRRALASRADGSAAFSNLLFMLNSMPRIGAAGLQAEHAEFGRRFAQPAPRAHPNAADPERPLRIGYVSPDFRRHSVAFFIAPVLAHQDRERYPVTCYFASANADATTHELRPLAVRWREVFSLNDEALAALVRADAIDILVDLAGHTGGSRLRAFALKPAPLQGTWLGYPTLTGLPSLDFRITDPRVDEPDAPPAGAERPVRLASSYFCYGGPGVETAVMQPPALASGRITFGSFNNLMKISAPTMALWSRVLHALPHSRLIVKSRPLVDPQVRAHLQQRLAASGIASERVVLLERHQGLIEHLASYGEIDIALDTFPYNGATTTCEALWMGVPVVSLRGETHASRMGASILSAAGLSDFVCRNEDDYVAKCVATARDLQTLASLRRELRSRLLASPLMDAARFTRDLEANYRHLWRDWCMRK